MRILYIHQYFKTPEEGGAIRSYYLASALVKAGHEVVMLSSHNQPHYKNRTIEGIDVHYLPVYYDNSMNTLERSRAFFSFLRQARSAVGRLLPFDLCYASSTPLTVGLIALYAQKRYKIPFMFEVRDLWPEAPIQLGYIRSKAIKAALRKLEGQLYKKARHVIALSPGMAAGVQKFSPSAPIHTIPNMADCSFFKPGPKNISFARLYGLENAFVIGYFGAAGPANHLDYLLEAARACELQQIKVKFLIAAMGSELEELKERVSITHSRNVVFAPYGSKQEVQNWLSITDAVYTSFGPYPVLETNSPNKFFDGLAAGKLSIVNTKGWLKDLVEENQCGFYAKPYEPEEFVARLMPFLEDPALLEEYQQNARKLALDQFSKEKLTARLLTIIAERG